MKNIASFKDVVVFLVQIAKYLEERCHKELRSEHIKFINVIAEVYNKLLCMCKEQMWVIIVHIYKNLDEL